MKTTPTEAVRAIAKALLVGIVAGSLLSACGGGGGGSAAKELLVERVEPADGIVGVAINARVMVIFTTVVDCASVNAADVALTDGSGKAVSGRVKCTPGTRGVAFYPDALDYGTTYTVHVSVNIQDVDGATLGGTYSWSFTTVQAPGAGAEKIDPDFTGSTSAEAMGLDGTGKPLMIYYAETAPSTYEIRARTYESGTWGAHSAFETATSAYLRRSAVGANGNALHVWINSAQDTVFAGYYTAGSGWSAESQVSVNAGQIIQFLDVAVDQDGNALVLWTERLFAGKEQLWARRYIAGPGPGAGWQTAEAIGFPGYYNQSPRVAYDKDGNATVVWQRTTFLGGGGVASSIQGMRLLANGTWEAASTVGGGGYGTSAPDLGIDSNGIVTVVWANQWYDYSLREVWANRRGAAATTWDSADAKKIGPNITATESPRIRVTPDGFATVVWRYKDPSAGTHYYDIEAAYFDTNPVIGWRPMGSIYGDAYKVVEGYSSDALHPVMVMHGSTFSLVYYKSDGTRTNLYMMTHSPQSNYEWAAPQEIDTTDNDLNYWVAPLLAIDGTGQITVVWNQPDGIWFMRP